MAIVALEPVDQVVQGVAAMIGSGEYGAGEVFAEPGLTAQRFGVSVKAASVAYTVLAQYGWLVRSARGAAAQWRCARGTPVPVGIRPA